MNPDETRPPEGRDDGHLRYLLTAYIFGDISAAGCEEVETHLAACDECREEYELLVETIGVVGAVVNEPEDPADYSFETRRRERVLAASKRRGVIARLPGGWFTAAAAALLLFVFVFIPAQLNRQLVARAPSIGADSAVLESSYAADTKDALSSWGATSQEPMPTESPRANAAMPRTSTATPEVDSVGRGFERGKSLAQKREIQRRPTLLREPVPGGAPSPPKAAVPAPEPVADPSATAGVTFFGVEAKSNEPTRGRATNIYDRYKGTDTAGLKPGDDGRPRGDAARSLAASNDTWGFEADSEDEDTITFDADLQIMDELRVEPNEGRWSDTSVGLIAPNSNRPIAGFEGLSLGATLTDTRTGGESYGYGDAAGAQVRGGRVAGRATDKDLHFSQRLQGQLDDSPTGWSNGVAYDSQGGPGSGGGGAGGLTSTGEPSIKILAADGDAPRLKPDKIRPRRVAPRGRFREKRKAPHPTKKEAPRSELAYAAPTFQLTPPSQPQIESGISGDTLIDGVTSIDASRRAIGEEVAAGAVRRGASLARVQPELRLEPHIGNNLTSLNEFLPAQGENQRAVGERSQIAVAGETVAPSEGAFAEFAERRLALDGKRGERTRSKNRGLDGFGLEDRLEQEPEEAEEIDEDGAESIRFYRGGSQGWFAYDPNAFQALAEADDRERQLRAGRYFREIDPGSAEADSEFEVPEPTVGDEGLGREGFRKRYSVNPFVDTRVDYQSTFAMDVDTAAYRRAVDLVESGSLPEPDAVRVEAFVNSLQEEFPADPDHDFSVFCEGAPSPFGNDVDLLKITVKARELEDGERLPSVLTLAIDTSGSMLLEERLTTVRQSLGMLLDALSPDDRVAVVAYGSEAYLALPHTAARERERILSVLEGLEPQGDTNVEAGLDLAYRVADESYATRALNRVVLLSDGVATSGARTADDLVERARLYAGRGLYLSVVGFGRERYDDAFLGTLAQAGNGNYAYVDSVESAYNLFVRDLPSTIQVLARDAKIQVEFDRGTVESYRLLGYVNRDIADHDFRNDSVDAGEVGPGSTVTALYEIRRRPSSHGSLGRIAVRYHATTTGRVEELGFPLQVGVLATSLAEASDALLFSACLAETAELLMDSYWARTGSFGRVAQLLAALRPEFRTRDDVQELSNLVTRAQQLVVERLSQ
ncbi:MAG: von Willebrand factor type A domain-containing protein [Planctomycetota bacterium]